MLELISEMGLCKTKDTRTAEEITGHIVYAVKGEEDMILSTYDFIRRKTCPDGILCIAKVTIGAMFCIHVSKEKLTADKVSYLKEAVELLKIQMYVKAELDG